MIGLTRLHDLAAHNGDGLRPEFLDLMRRRASIEDDPAVVELPSDGWRSAGPPPMPGSQATLPASVLCLRPKTTIHSKQLKERKGKQCI